MERKKLLSTIQDFIVQGKLKEAIDFGIEFLKNKDFIPLASRYRRVIRANAKGTITFEQYQVELNRITEALLELLCSYSEKEHKRKKRGRFVLWLVFTGLFMDWRKVISIFKLILTVLVLISIIVLGINNFNESERLELTGVIESPIDGEVLSNKIVVQGTITGVKEGMYIWLVTARIDSLNRLRYWPKAMLDISNRSVRRSKWSQVLFENYSESSSDLFDLYLVAVQDTMNLNLQNWFSVSSVDNDSPGFYKIDAKILHTVSNLKIRN